MTKYKIIFSFLLIIFILSFSISAKEYEISDYNINLSLEDSGSYLITELITFNFTEGSFSWISRNVMDKGFDNLEFISARGININLTEHEVNQNNDLEIKLYFPESSGKRSFELKYRADGGLITADNINIIDWMAVGSEWDIPIHNLNIELRLPQAQKIITAEPIDDIVEKTSNYTSFHKNTLSPNENYRITVRFPLFQKTHKNTSPFEENKQKSNHGIAITVGLILAFIILVFDIASSNKVQPIKGKIKYHELTITEQALIITKGAQNRKGISACIFTLAKEKKIKLLSKIKKGVFGTKNAEIKAVILDEENLTEEGNVIIEKLKKHKSLKKFAGDYKVFNKVHKIAKNHLKTKDLISSKALYYRKRICFSSIFFLATGTAALIYGGIKDISSVLGLGMFLIICGIGRLIKGASLLILSEEGYYLKKEIEKDLNDKKDKLDQLTSEKKADEALNYFFDNLEKIILHKKFNVSTLNKYKKVFKKAENINIPEWIEFDLINLDETLDALDIVELIDYMMTSLVVIAYTTGASGYAGTTGGGGAAGGGGGAAG